MIQYDFCIEDINKYQIGDLPEQAVRLDSPKTMDDMMKKCVPFFITVAVLLNVIVAITVRHHKISIHPIGLIAGIMIGFALLIVHELLHACVYPKHAQVTVGKLKKQLLFVALASYPVKRSRFILMCLLPFVLGILPLTLFIFGVFDNAMIDWILFGMGAMGMLSPAADVINVFYVLKQSDRSSYIMFYGEDIYKFRPDETPVRYRDI